MRRFLSFFVLVLSVFFAVSCSDSEPEQETETKTVCNDTGDCKDRASYCDTESPHVDEVLGTTVYYCKKRQICKTQSQCSMGWRCKESEGFCITNEEADIILCTKDEDCTNPSFPKCNLKTRECTASDNSSSDPSNDLPDQNDTDSGTNDDDSGDSGDSDTETSDDDSNTGTSEQPKGESIMTENFEDDGTNWTIEPANSDTPCWEIGIPTSGPEAAHDGEKVAATILSGDYPGNCKDVIYYNTEITIPSEGVPAISFYASVDIVGTGYSPYDYVEVLVKKNGEAWEMTSGLYLSADTESTLTHLDNTRTKITKQPQDGKYRYYKFTGDLSAYKGEKIQIGFRFTSDATSAGMGFYLDDVEVSY